MSEKEGGEVNRNLGGGSGEEECDEYPVCNPRTQHEEMVVREMVCPFCRQGMRRPDWNSETWRTFEAYFCAGCHVCWQIMKVGPDWRKRHEEG